MGRGESNNSIWDFIDASNNTVDSLTIQEAIKILQDESSDVGSWINAQELIVSNIYNKDNGLFRKDIYKALSASTPLTGTFIEAYPVEFLYKKDMNSSLKESVREEFNKGSLDTKIDSLFSVPVGKRDSGWKSILGKEIQCYASSLTDELKVDPKRREWFNKYRDMITPDSVPYLREYSGKYHFIENDQCACKKDLKSSKKVSLEDYYYNRKRQERFCAECYKKYVSSKTKEKMDSYSRIYNDLYFHGQMSSIHTYSYTASSLARRENIKEIPQGMISLMETHPSFRKNNTPEEVLRNSIDISLKWDSIFFMNHSMETLLAPDNDDFRYSQNQKEEGLKYQQLQTDYLCSITDTSCSKYFINSCIKNSSDSRGFLARDQIRSILKCFSDYEMSNERILNRSTMTDLVKRSFR